MSYIKAIGNWNVIFKDEESYLEAKLEKIRDYPDIPFIGFLQNEMYDKSKCEVEGIEDYSNYYTYNVEEISEGSLVMGDHIPSSTSDSYIGTATEALSSGESFFQWTYNGDQGQIQPISSSTVYDNGTWNINTQCIPYHDEEKKEQEPEDPIDNRFDILDL